MTYFVSAFRAKLAAPRLAAWLICFVAPLEVFAACSRADVDYFLSRNFTTEQVVALCGGESVQGADAPKDTPIVISEATEAERELRDLLLRTVDAQKVDVTAESVAWTDKRCVEYAAPNLAGRPRELCGPVRIKVARESLSTGQLHHRVLFFGDHGVELLGEVEQQWRLDQAGLSDTDRRRVAEATPSQVDSVLLPLHSSAEPKEVGSSLQRWAETR